jgi:hypothetical protein
MYKEKIMWWIIGTLVVIVCGCLLGRNSSICSEEEEKAELREQALFLAEWDKKHSRKK